MTRSSNRFAAPKRPSDVTVASLTQREAELQNANASLKRSEELFKEGLVSPQEFEQQKTSVAVFEAQVQLAQAQKTPGGGRAEGTAHPAASRPRFTRRWRAPYRSATWTRARW